MAKKLILGGIAVVIVAVIIGVVFVIQNLDAIVKEVVERVGSRVLGTEVTLEAVRLDLRDGNGTLTGFVVRNPPGYSADDMFRLDNIDLDIDVDSLTGPVYVINEVSIDGVHILAEMGGTGSNFQTVMDNVEQAQREAGLSSAADEAEPVEGEDVLLAVGKFSFANSSARLKSSQLGEHDLDLPALRLSALGSRENGLTPDAMASEAVDQVFSQIWQAIKDKLKELAQDSAEQAAKDALEENLSDEDRARIEAAKKLFGR